MHYPKVNNVLNAGGVYTKESHHNVYTNCYASSLWHIPSGKAVWREVIQVTFLNMLVEGAEILVEISQILCGDKHGMNI